MAERRNIDTACAAFMVEIAQRIPAMWSRLTHDGAVDLPLTVHVLYEDGGNGCFSNPALDDGERDAAIAHARVMASRRRCVGAVVMFETCLSTRCGPYAGEPVETLVLLLQRRNAKDRVLTWPITRADARRALLGEREQVALVDIATYDVLHSAVVEH